MALFTYTPGGTVLSIPTFVPTASAAFVAGPSLPAAVVPPVFTLTTAPFPVVSIGTLYDTIWLFRIFPTTALGGVVPPRTLGYGNVLTDIVDPCLIFSSYRLAAQLGALLQAGTTQGVVLSTPNYNPSIPPPNPPAPTSTTPFALPAAIQPGQQLPFDVVIYVDNDFSTIAVIYSSVVTATTAAGVSVFSFPFFVSGSRAVLIQFLPDWKEAPPALTIEFKDDIFDSDQHDEQRTTTLLPRVANVPGECAHQIDYQYKSEGRQRSTDLWNALTRVGARRAAIPIAIEPIISGADAAGVNTITSTYIRLEHFIFLGEEIVRLDRRDPYFAETRKVIGFNFDTNQISVDAPWGASIPAVHQEFYFVRYCYLAGAARENASDEHQVVNVAWRSQD